MTSTLAFSLALAVALIQLAIVVVATRPPRRR